MDLVLFDQAMLHHAYRALHLAAVGQHAMMLVGVGGAGMQSLTMRRAMTRTFSVLDTKEAIKLCTWRRPPRRSRRSGL